MMVKGICTAVKHRASPLQSSAVHLVFAFCSPRKYFQGLEIGLSKEKSAVKKKKENKKGSPEREKKKGDEKRRKGSQ